MPKIDIRILEILTSKVCHDLISPIGAVNNGVEFMQEMGVEDAADGLDLIAFSAQQASAKLTAYRMAYGSGGADNSIKPEDVYNIIQDIVGAESKITQDWDKDAPICLNEETFERPTGFGKILICGLLLAMDCLPKGGVLSVTHDGDKDFTIFAKGENSDFRDGTQPALTHKISSDDLEPKNVHPYVMGLLAEQYGFSVALKPIDAECVSIAVTV
ncbi:MAG: histidine phosphotransferase family protein [Bdellovibrionales bacterium]